MAQQTNTTNWLIQGSNGQPQMIKLMQQSGKPFNGSLMTSSITGQPVKIIKSAPGDSQQIFTNVSSNQVIRSISTPTKVVTKTIPIHVNKIPSMKTIKLSPNQLQDIKLSQTPTKIEFSSQPFNSTLTTVPVYTTTQTSPVVKNSSPKILSRKRHDHVELEFAPESKRGRKSEKVGKGLRHFSMKVCEKVKLKGTTSYNEVADELVTEFSNSTNNALADQYDQKNIRRRVYDALNVLMAMNIISKEKKEIRWIGLPTNSLQECHQLEIDMKNKLRTILEKEKQLDELILNQIAFKNLAQRNRESEKKFGTPSPNSYIHLPFIVVNTNKKTVINCSISTDKLEYMFQFNDKFEINDDVEILKSIGMLSGLDTGTCTSENLEKIKSFIPQSLWPYLEKIANNCRPQSLDNILEEARASTSSISMLNADDFVEAHLDEENSRQSSSFFEGMSPSLQDFSEEEGDSDISSEGGDIH